MPKDIFQSSAKFDHRNCRGASWLKPQTGRSFEGGKSERDVITQSYKPWEWSKKIEKQEWRNGVGL